VSAADITRLETMAAGIARSVEALRESDPTLAGDVSARLADLNDEVTYLRVKLRREGSVTRDEYASLRDRLDTLQVRVDADGARPEATADQTTASPSIVTVPVGTEFDVRLQRSEEHTSELQSRENLVCRLPHEKKTTTLQ